MICPSKLSHGQLAKLTDQEIIDIYMVPTTRWKDTESRIWMVFSRQAQLLQAEGKISSKATGIELVNIHTEKRVEVTAERVGRRIRSGELVRYEQILSISR